MVMSTDPTLTLAQWFSPAFPVGAFSFSHGLESMPMDAPDAEATRDWLAQILEHGTGRNDALFLCAAWRGEPPLAETDALARAFAPSRERLLETEELGASFVQAVNAVWGCDLPPLAYPVAVGAAARACDLPLPATLRMYLHAFAAAQISAAIRLGAMGQTEGQAILLALIPLCEAIAETSLAASLDDLGGSAFCSDIASMAHETRYSRMFRT